MRIAKRGRYALKLMLDLVHHSGCDGLPVSLASVARRIGISHGYLEQIAIVLRRAGLVGSVAGRHGGYLLARGADDITVRDVIEAVLGPTSIVECLHDREACPLGVDCECWDAFALINQRIIDTMQKMTLAELARSPRRGGAGPVLHRHEVEIDP